MDRERFKSAWLKVDRAEEHLKAFKEHLFCWLSRRPYSVAKEFDPKSGRHGLVLEIRETANFDKFSIIAGDCAHNARSALDHVVYSLATEGPNGLPENLRPLQFPICNSSDNFHTERYRIASLTEEAKEFIESKQPYHRQNPILPPILAVLKKFDDVDKHRLAHLTYDCNIAGKLIFTRNINEIVSPTVWPNQPLKDGDEFAHFFSESKREVPYNFEVSFTIGVSHLPGPGGRSVSPLEAVLVGMVEEVKRIVNSADEIRH